MIIQSQVEINNLYSHYQRFEMIEAEFRYKTAAELIKKVEEIIPIEKEEVKNTTRYNSKIFVLSYEDYCGLVTELKLLEQYNDINRIKNILTKEYF